MYDELNKKASEVKLLKKPFEFDKFTHQGEGIFALNSEDSGRVTDDFALYLGTKAGVLFRKGSKHYVEEFDDLRERFSSKNFRDTLRNNQYQKFEEMIKDFWLYAKDFYFYNDGTMKQFVVIGYEQGGTFNASAVVHPNYEVYPHENVVKQISDVKEYLRAFYIQNGTLEVFLKTDEENDHVSFYILNGHNGREAISYNIVFNAGKFKYAFDNKFVKDYLKKNEFGDTTYVRQRNRHLSWQNQTTDNIQHAFNALKEFNFKALINRIKITDFREKAIDIAKENYDDPDVLVQLISTANSNGSTYGLLLALVMIGNQRGFIGKMNKILTKLFEYFIG